MRGLDPRIHLKKVFFQMMDCWVKPGNNGGMTGFRSYCKISRR